ACLLVGGCLAAVGPTGCKQREQTTAPAVTRQAKDEAVAVTLQVQPKDPTAGETGTVRLDILADAGVTVLPPDYADRLGEGDRRYQYRAVLRNKVEAVPADNGRLRWRYEYEVTFLVPGETELPAAEVSYLLPLPEDQATEASGSESTAPPQHPDDTERTLSTEPITLTVRLPEGMALTENDLRKVERPDPVPLRVSRSRWWIVAAAGGLLIALAVAWGILRKRRRRLEPIPVIPPHEWARARLAELIAEDLIARGRVREFYYRISDVVRGYIERRFGVSAPEMTTEEFLAAATRDPRLAGETSGWLQSFLNACDLVKYARHRPADAECREALRLASEFVDRTTPREPGIEPVAADAGTGGQAA
ncbi:MAG: hypothetical protein D6788_02105, partial [Planctomycetota bacterium]